MDFSNGRTHGAPYHGYGYVPLRFRGGGGGGGGNVVRRMGTQQQQRIMYFGASQTDITNDFCYTESC